MKTEHRYRHVVLLTVMVIAVNLLASFEARAETTPGGYVALKTSLMEVGVNLDGYFGIPGGEIPSGYHPHFEYMGLGFVADYRHNNWTGQYGGDYFTPGTPYEGFSVKWDDASGSPVFVNAGGMETDMTRVSLVDASTPGGTQSAVWTGIAGSGSEQLELIQTYSFEPGNLFFTGNVQVINVGTSTLKNVRFARSLDPDNDESWGGSYTTSNEIVYQPTTGDNRALVTAAGTSVTDMVLGLAAMDSRASVTADAQWNTDPDICFSNIVQSVTDDTSICLGFELGDLAPGQSTSLNFAYVLSAADLANALGTLGAVTIVEPSGTVSGKSVPFQVTTSDMANTSRVDFYVNGALIGSSTAPSGGVFSTTFDSTAYPDGSLSLKAVATVKGSQASQSASVLVSNAGPPLAFVAPANGATVSGDGIAVQVSSTDASNPPTQVAFFREVVGLATVDLGSVTSAPFASTFNTSDLPAGTTVTLRAIGQNASGNTTNIAISVVTGSSAPVVASLTPSSGTSQSATVGTAFGSPVCVLVADSGAKPIAGVTVTFGAPSSGASATFAAIAISDASGQACTDPAANTVAGSYTLTASAASLNADAATLTNTAGPPATMVADGPSSPQSAVVGGIAFAQALGVTVQDGYGNAVVGTTVSFTVPSSGATALLSGEAATTDGDGHASVTASSGDVAGGYLVTATAGDASTAFSLTNTTGPVAQAIWAKTSAGSQSTTVGSAFPYPLALVVEDSYGNPVAGVSVTFSAASDGGTGFHAILSSTTALSGADGVAQVTATANDVSGWERCGVSLDGKPLDWPGFLLTATADVPASLSVDAASTPQSATVGGNAFARALGATVYDRFGNAVPGAVVSFAAPSNGATAALSSGAATTDSVGHAQVTASSGSVAGGYSVVAIVGALSASYSLTNLVGPPTTLSLVSGDGQHSSVDGSYAQALLVQAADSLGNPVSDALVTYTVQPAAGASATLSSLTAYTDALGQASVTASPNTVAGAFTVSAALTGVLSPCVFTLTNDPGVPATVTADVGAATQSAQVTTAFLQALLVAVQDSHGNPVPGVTVSYGGPASGPAASFSSAAATTGSAGTASVTATANSVAGGYAVTASVDGVTPPATFSLTNLSGPPGSLAVVGGGTQQAIVGAAYASPLKVAVLDAEGNPVSGATVSFSAPASGASAALSPASAETGTDGTVAASATANTVSGAYLVTASAEGVSGSVQFSLANLPGAAVGLVVDGSSSGQSARVGEAFSAPLLVTVVDAYGNGVPGVTVSFACPSSAPTCTLDSSSETSDASGQVVIHATAGATPGTATATASSSGLPSASISLTDLVGLPGTIESTGGASQSAGVFTAYANPLGVLVKDSYGNPVPGVTVTFAVVSGGAQTVELSATTVETGGDGQASVTATANADKGALLVEATAPGVATAAQFALTNTGIATVLTPHIDLPVFGTVVQETATTHLRVAVGPDAGHAHATGTVTFQASRPMELVSGQVGVTQQGDAVVATLVDGAVDVPVRVVGWRSRTLEITYSPDDAAASTWNPASITVNLTADVQNQTQGAKGGCSTGGGGLALAWLPLLLLALRLRRRPSMKRLWLLSALLVAAIPGFAQAQWYAGARLGYAMAGGQAASGSNMSDGLKSQIPIQVEGGYRLLSKLAVGGYFSYGPGQVGSVCEGTSCSASVMRLGAEAAWQFDRWLTLLPWAGLGIGYEWANYQAKSGSDTLKLTYRGFEYLDLQGGLEYPLREGVSVGPFASFALARYTNLDVKSPLGNSTGSIPSQATHSWLTLGVRGSWTF